MRNKRRTDEEWLSLDVYKRQIRTPIPRETIVDTDLR